MQSKAKENHAPRHNGNFQWQFPLQQFNIIPPRQNKTPFYICISFPKHKTSFLIKLPIPTAPFIGLFSQPTPHHASMLTCRHYRKTSLFTRGKYLKKEILASYLVCFSLSKNLDWYKPHLSPSVFLSAHHSLIILHSILCLVERAPITLPRTGPSAQKAMLYLLWI